MNRCISFAVSLPPIQLSHISTPHPLTSTLTHSRLDSSPLRLHYLGLTPSLVTPHNHSGRQPAKVRYVCLCSSLVEGAGCLSLRLCSSLVEGAVASHCVCVVALLKGLVPLIVLTPHTAWKRSCQPQSHMISHRSHMTSPQSHMTCPQSHMTSQIPAIWMTSLSGECV